MFIGGIGGAFLIQILTYKILPTVEYPSDLVGVSYKYIKRIKWFFYIVFLPIILNITASLIKDYIDTFIP